MVIREGVPTLEKHISVPDVLRDARWAARPKGQAGSIPGPTDLELLAWFPVPDADRAAVEAAIGAPEAETTVSVPSELAVVLPEAVRGSPQGGTVTLRGAASPAVPFENIRWTAAFAVWLPGGIAVYLHSR